MAAKLKLNEAVLRREQEVLSEWISDLQASGAARPDLMRTEQLRDECREFLRLFMEAAGANVDDATSPGWGRVREMVGEMSRTRGRQGFTASETAAFVMSLKKPLLGVVRQEEEEVVEGFWKISEALDRLALYTTEVYQKGREEVIQRQQQEMLELSTPVVKLAENVLALPLIGSLDSSRTQVVMETLLQRIVETGCRVAIIDITGVPTVDTLVAQHLLKTIAAARLMGAECIISGIRPQIAQTMVHLALDLGDVQTKATLADAFATALRTSGLTIARLQG